MATAIYSGVMFWNQIDSPSNFSYFLMLAQSSSTVTDTADIIALSLKSADGRGGIDKEDIIRLTKQKVYIPMRTNELEHHINHGVHLLSILFGKDSFIVSQISDCQSHIQENQIIYEDILRHGSMFPAKVLYVMDVRTQKFLKEAQKEIFSPKPLDFSSMFEEIVQNRTFNAKLPCSTHRSKRNRESEDKQDKPNRARKDDRDKWSENQKPNPEWTLKNGENFSQTLPKNKDKAPYRNNIPIYMNYQIRGSCHDQCSLYHENIDRGTATHTAMSKLCADCRSGVF